MRRVAFVLAAALCVLPVVGRADLAAARQIPGAPIARDARYVFGFGQSLAVVNDKGELWLHPATGKSARQIPGPTIAHDGTPARFCFALDAKRIGVVNAAGELWVHDIGEAIGPAHQIPGAKIAAEAPAATNIVSLSPRELGVISADGAVSVHALDDVVEAARRVPGRLSHGTSAPKYVLAFGKVVAIVNESGELWTHLVLPAMVSPGMLVPGPPIAVGGQPARFVFPWGNGVGVVNSAGELWVHDMLEAAQVAVAPVPDTSCDLAGPWTKQYDEKKDGRVEAPSRQNDLEISGRTGKLVAKYVGSEAKNRSTFKVSCKTADGATAIVIDQKDKKYTSRITATAQPDGSFVGTWIDNSGHAGDIVLFRSGGM